MATKSPQSKKILGSKLNQKGSINVFQKKNSVNNKLHYKKPSLTKNRDMKKMSVALDGEDEDD